LHIKKKEVFFYLLSMLTHSSSWTMAWVEYVVAVGPVLMVVIVVVWVFVGDGVGVVFMGKDMGMLVLILPALIGCYPCYGV
jgi:hypothetical protein